MISYIDFAGLVLGDRQKVTVRYNISKFSRYNYYHVIICDHYMSFFAGFDEMLILYCMLQFVCNF